MSELTRDLEAPGPDAGSIARAAGPDARSERWTGLWRLMERLNRVAAGEDVLDELASDLGLVTGFDVVLVERYDPLEHRVRVVARAGVDPRKQAVDASAVAADGRTFFGAQLGEFVLFAPAPGAPRFARERLERLGVETFCCAPIRCGDQRLGALSLGARRPCVDDGGLREILQGVADHLGAAWTASLLLELSREHARLEHAARAGWILAHELRNPLQTVSLQLASLRHRLGELPESLHGELAGGLRTLEDESVRLHELLQHYLRLGQQRPELRRSRVLLRELLDGVLRFYEVSLRGAGIVLELDLPGEPVRLWVDVAQICQVLHNLLRNALDAMPHGGRLGLSARSTPSRVEIQLRDSGPGIRDPEAALAFFASTRPGGTGLGLPVSREILRAHGGDLDILPVPSGALLRLSLPRDEPPA